MTREEFLAALRETPAEGWGLREGGLLRRGGDCPITAVCVYRTGREFDADDYEKAAEVLGLTARDAERISDAADDLTFMQRGLTALRKALLDATVRRGGPRA